MGGITMKDRTKNRPHRKPYAKGSKGGRSTGVQRKPSLPVSWFKKKK
jgi:hypothetical protein